MALEKPKRGRNSTLWDDIDVELIESDEEARQYDERVRTEIKWKETSDMASLGNIEIDVESEHLAGNITLQQQSDSIDQGMVLPSALSGSQIHTSQVVNTRDNSKASAMGTPHLARLTGQATLPSVPTPKDVSTPLPIPSKRASTSRLRHATLQTPDAIPSPIDTPDTVGPTRSTIDPGTPVPLGTAAFAALRGKKDYQTLTKHFEAFEKTVAKREEANISAATRLSRTRSVSSKPPPALGGRVFAGLRFCIPPELGQVTKHKQRWDIISRLGGHVTLQPDTAITHVIYDKTSASLLARDLGLQTLSELPESTICVRWDWVVNCKLAGKLLDTAMYLCFPKNTLTHAASTNLAFKAPNRIMDITDQLRGKSISISKKREHTASDSDTESPRKTRRAPLIRGTIGLSRSALAAKPLLRSHPSIATNHALPSGPGWEIAPEGAQDGLDAMISGVVNGTIEEEEDLDNDTGNPDKMANSFRCGQKHDGIGNKGPNEWLAKKFEEMHDLYQGVQGKNPFAIRQYQQAASLCRRTLVPITSGKEALKLKGVGQSIADRIDEFISGAPGRQFYEDNEQSRTIAMFKDIYGVGRTFANELYRRGARNMNDLRTKDYGLTPGQMIGVELYDDLIDRIPREECRQLYEIVRAEAVAIDPKVWIEIMGSYRRGQETSGDVDILITRDTADGLDHSLVLKKLTDRLKTRKIITHDLGVPHDWRGLEAKWMGVGRLNSDSKYRRIGDILCIPFEQWGAALIYFTGNEIFNRSLRLYARKKGYSLNQRGLSVGVIRDKQGLKMTEGEIIASRTEQDIFNVLGLRYRHPHQRQP